MDFFEDLRIGFKFPRFCFPNLLPENIEGFSVLPLLELASTDM